MDRQNKVLKAIVQRFIETAQPVGSNTILVSYQFKVSPATIRNDMASLEREGMIYQPHTSAGRVPTNLGYRKYIDTLADIKEVRQRALADLEKIKNQYKKNKVRERIYDAVNLLIRCTENVSFATVPDNSRTFFLGLSNVLKQPEFVYNAMQASQVVEVLEKSDRFISTLNELEIDDKPKVFIGEENIIEQIQSCSIMVCRYRMGDFKGYLGLLGPTRMKYTYNMVMLEEIKKMLEEVT